MRLKMKLEIISVLNVANVWLVKCSIWLDKPLKMPVLWFLGVLYVGVSAMSYHILTYSCL